MKETHKQEKTMFIMMETTTAKMYTYSEFQIFFILHYFKRLQQSNKIDSKVRRKKKKQNITEIIKGKMCAVTKGA